MNPRDRLLATIRGDTPDRVPLILHGFLCATRDDLDSMGDAGRREIAERIFDRTAAPLSFGAGVNRYFVTPRQFMHPVDSQQTDGKVRTTTRIDTPRGPLLSVTERNTVTDTIWTVKYPVQSLQDIEKIRSVPWERPPDLAPPDLSGRPATFDRKCFVRTSVSSPFVCVAGMMPYDCFLELCATDLGLMKELTAECARRILDLLEVVLSAGTVEYVWMGGCEWLTPPMGSPRLYEELVQGPETQVIERIHAAGALVHVHCHGKVRSTLERAVRRGADYFEPTEPPPDGDVTFAEAKQIVSGRMTLGGNVEARILAHADGGVVAEATRAAFEGGRGHMVLSDTAGPISPMTPRMIANYHRVIDVWEELSPL